jgi:dihydroflavonol-4-reductase
LTVLLTGASGHVGSNLVRALIDDGRKVRVFVRDDTRGVDGLDVQHFRGDVLEPDTLKAAIDGAEVVYHCAARISIVGDPDGMVMRTNVEGTRNIVRACLDAGVRRLVHFSSLHAFSQAPLDEPLDETRAFVGDRAYAYDRSKAAGSREVLAGVEQGLDAVIVHPSAMLGVHDYKGSRMSQALLDLYHDRLPSLIDGGFDWVDVRDVVSTALAAEARGRTGEAYVASGHYASVAELAAMVSEFSGKRPPRFVCPQWLAYVGVPFAALAAKISGSEPLFTSEALGALRSNHDIRHDKAVQELGHAPRPLRETVADTLRWFEERGAPRRDG